MNAIIEQAQAHPFQQNQIYRQIVGRVQFHIQITRRQSKLYHWCSLCLQWVTPVLAALVTAFAGQEHPGGVTMVLGLVVTVLTVLNSTVHPYERALFAKRFSNKFWEFHTDFQRAVEQLDFEYDDDAERKRQFYRLLDRANNEVVDLIEQFNAGPDLPTALPVKSSASGLPRLTDRPAKPRTLASSPPARRRRGDQNPSAEGKSQS